MVRVRPRTAGRAIWLIRAKELWLLQAQIAPWTPKSMDYYRVVPECAVQLLLASGHSLPADLRTPALSADCVEKPPAVDASGDKAPEAPAPLVMLGKLGDEPIVNGVRKAKLTMTSVRCRQGSASRRRRRTEQGFAGEREQPRGRPSHSETPCRFRS